MLQWNAVACVCAANTFVCAVTESPQQRSDSGRPQRERGSRIRTSNHNPEYTGSGFNRPSVSHSHYDDYTEVLTSTARTASTSAVHVLLRPALLCLLPLCSDSRL